MHLLNPNKHFYEKLKLKMIRFHVAPDVAVTLSDWDAALSFIFCLFLFLLLLFVWRHTGSHDMKVDETPDFSVKIIILVR